MPIASDIEVTDTTHDEWAAALAEAQARRVSIREAEQQRKRKTGQPSNVALPRTLMWAAGLPAEVQPHELLRSFARIANFLASGWQEPESMRLYFADLLGSQRPQRCGFPAPVAAELQRLDAYYRQRLLPPGPSHSNMRAAPARHSANSATL